MRKVGACRAVEVFSITKKVEDARKISIAYGSMMLSIPFLPVPYVLYSFKIKNKYNPNKSMLKFLLA